MTERFAGKVAVVTGGVSGIGRACARALVREGADVVIMELHLEPGEPAGADLADGPGRALFVHADVRDAGQIAAAFAEAERTFGGVDILFNNAGVNAVGHIDQLTEEGWDECLDTNLKGAFLASREAIPRLRQRGGGVIINNASNAGLMARAADPAYCASKAGLIMLTRSMALAYAADRIRVNAICPGPVAGTRLMQAHLSAQADPEAAAAAVMAAAPLTAALGRMITPEEIAAAVLYLCSDEAQLITGAVLAIDGGKSAGIPR